MEGICFRLQGQDFGYRVAMDLLRNGSPRHRAFLLLARLFSGIFSTLWVSGLLFHSH